MLFECSECLSEWSGGTAEVREWFPECPFPKRSGPQSAPSKKKKPSECSGSGFPRRPSLPDSARLLSGGSFLCTFLAPGTFGSGKRNTADATGGATSHDQDTFPQRAVGLLLGLPGSRFRMLAGDGGSPFPWLCATLEVSALPKCVSAHMHKKDKC